MNSTNLRYVAAVLQFTICGLASFKVIDPAQAVSLTAGLMGAYHLAQGQLTPDTNARTPNDAPTKT